MLNFKIGKKFIKIFFSAFFCAGIFITLLFAADIYYDLDLGKTIIKEITKIVNQLETTATTTLATLEGNVGIGTTTPASLLTVGSTGGFQVNSNGNLIKINGVTYSWPPSQGAANTYLKNDGSGNLSWAEIAGGGGGIGGSGATNSVAFWISSDTLSYDPNFVWVTSTQRLGIGVSSPSEKLTVAGNIGIQAGQDSFIGTLDNYALSLRTNNTDRIYITNAGNVGIGTTTPEYKLDVAGNLRATLSLTAGINVETLTGNKTLTPGVDKMYQYLDPGSANRIITLATTTAKAGDKFIIRHNGTHNSSYYLQIVQGSTILDYIYARSIREYIFDGTNWVSGDVGTGIDGDWNVALGHSADGYVFGTAVGAYASGSYHGAAVGAGAVGYNAGAAVGYEAIGYNAGAAVGYDAIGYNAGVAVGAYAYGSYYGAAVGYGAYGDSYGAAVGYYASGSSYGAAVGYEAVGYNSGAAVGYDAIGYNSGAAVGYYAFGYNSGAAVGYYASGYNSGAAVGYYAKGMRYGVAVGYYAGYSIDTNADRYNVLVGAYSGYRLTTGIGNIILGYQSGYDATYSPTTGSKNILIGFQAGTPATTTSNFLNIGNLIFATGVNTATGTAISTGNVGIATTTPDALLTIWGSTQGITPLLRIATSTTEALFIDSSGNIGIGTTVPSEKLTIAGNIGIQAGTDAFLGTLNNYGLSLKTNNTDRIFITNDGKVGIGTSTPNYKLTINGDLYVSATSTLANVLPISDNTYTLGSPSLRWANLYAVTTTIGGTIIIGSNTIQGTATTTIFVGQNQNQLVLTSDGKIGIGTSNPAYSLDLVGALRLQPSSQPTGAEGVLYYDSTDNKIKIFSGGGWKEFGDVTKDLLATYFYENLVEFVKYGLLPDTSATLTSDISAGVAYIRGYRVEKATTTYTYSSSTDTYVDLSKDGVFTFTEVPNGSTTPPVAPNSIRLAKVITDEDNIVQVIDLRNLSPVAYSTGIVSGDACSEAANLMNKSNDEAALILQGYSNIFAAQVISCSNFTADKTAGIADSSNITSAKIKVILDTGYINDVDKIAALLDGNSLNDSDAAAHVNSGVYSDSVMALAFNSTYLALSKAALIFNNSNLTASKAASICEHSNFSSSRAASIFDQSSLSVTKLAEIFGNSNLSNSKATSIFDSMNREIADIALMFNNSNVGADKVAYVLQNTIKTTSTIASLLNHYNLSSSKVASVADSSNLTSTRIKSFLDTGSFTDPDKIAALLDGASLTANDAATHVNSLIYTTSTLALAFNSTYLAASKAASICDSPNISSAKIKAILDTGSLTSADKIAALLDGDSLTAADAASHVNSGIYTDSLMASAFNSTYLAASKAVSIIDNSNLSVSKAVSILTNANLSANKTQSIMYAMVNYGKQIDIITNGASDVTYNSSTTISGTNRYNNLTINSDVTLTLDGQPNIIIANTLTNNGTMNKTKTGGAGGVAIQGAGKGGRGGGGLIIIVKNFDNNSTIQAPGEAGESGSNVSGSASGSAGDSGVIHRIGTDAVGKGGDGGYAPGYGYPNGGGGGSTYSLSGGTGRIVNYTSYATAGDLYHKLRKATIDWWLINFASKTPSATISFPNIYGSGGGGGAGNDFEGACGGGGGGGGQIIILADSFDNASGTISTNGGNGGNGGTEGNYDSGGGGGGGGIVYGLYRTNLVSVGTLSASGGAGGTGDYNGQPGATGTVATYSVSGADIAENYPTDDPTIGPGDLVRIKAGALNELGGIFQGENFIAEKYLIEKTSKPYDPQMIGVISVDPAIVLGEKGKENLRPVALVGRVPVKVSTINGEIKVGDYLTSSPIPGVAMRATRPGRVIGIALESYSGPKDQIGWITVFLNPHFAFPENNFDYFFTKFENQLSTISTTESTSTFNFNFNFSDFILAIKSALEKLGLFIENGIAKIKEIIAERITALKRIVAPVGEFEKIQMRDRATGEIYCVWLENGEWKKVKGNCEEEESGLNQSASDSSATTTESTSTETISTEPTSTQNISTQTCLPNWSCTEWEPSADLYCSNETVIQFRKCTDLNNCQTEEGKPPEGQEVKGNKNCSD